VPFFGVGAFSMYDACCGEKEFGHEAEWLRKAKSGGGGVEFWCGFFGGLQEFCFSCV
jgi:hypothetical protein